MRTVVLSNRMRLACQAAVIALIAGAGAGCSSDFTRFDNSIYNSTADISANNSGSENPYPDYLDSSTTSSVSSVPGQHPIPLNGVNDGQSVDGYATANSTYSPYNAPSATGNYGSASYQTTGSTSSVQRSELPQPTASSAISQTRKPGGADPGGWSSTGGTVITLKEGETLYNLSKRYGVPVKEIMKASDIRNASQVQAGQKVTIPTYMYSRNAPISAPDNNVNTRNARATTGSMIAPDAGKAPMPSKNPNQTASKSSNTSTGQSSARPSATAYIVQPGDTLSKIARENGTTVSALIAANQLAGTNVRIGQKLALPTGSTKTLASNSAPEVDRTVTGATDKNVSARASGPQPYVKPAETKEKSTKTAGKDTAAPSRTGIGDFRWPARGRVISNFGDKTQSGRNDGIDISVPVGTAIKAVENGVVVYSGDELEGYGNLILVRHSDGWVSAYANNKTLEVKRGDEVRRGEIIARSGRTGSASVPKLHFELRKDSSPVDPLKHLGSV
ncbi:MAG: peptidoglycan DD-metalloendopeptidase family protein [Rhizobiaceae bacterium]